MSLDYERKCHHSRCLNSCLETFRNSIFPGNRDFDQFCKILSINSSDSVFSTLYCCDLNCGADFDDGVGGDSNVKMIMKRCKRFGVSNIVDIGPPPTEKCSAIPSLTSYEKSPPSSSTTSMNSEVSIPSSMPILIPSTSNFTSTSQQTILLTPSTQTTFPTATPIPPPSNTSPISVAAATQKTLFQSFWQHLPSTSKIGYILGFTFLILTLLLLPLFLLIRHKRRTRRLNTRSPSIESFLDTPLPSQIHTPSYSFSPTTTSQSESLENSRIRRGDWTKGSRIARIIVMETEGRNSLDSSGIRWPDKVVLTGEAKEIREWSLEYGLGDREKRRRAAG